MKKIERFQIRPYSKYQLAHMYFPENTNPKSAVANLRNMINRCQQLRAELDAAGYQPRNKLLTPRQVRLIVHYVGEPFDYDE